MQLPFFLNSWHGTINALQAIATKRYKIPRQNTHMEEIYVCEQANRAGLENFRVFTYKNYYLNVYLFVYNFSNKFIDIPAHNVQFFYLTLKYCGEW